MTVTTIEACIYRDESYFRILLPDAVMPETHDLVRMREFYKKAGHPRISYAYSTDGSFHVVPLAREGKKWVPLQEGHPVFHEGSVEYAACEALYRNGVESTVLH